MRDKEIHKGSPACFERGIRVDSMKSMRAFVLLERSCSGAIFMKESQSSLAFSQPSAPLPSASSSDGPSVVAIQVSISRLPIISHLMYSMEGRVDKSGLDDDPYTFTSVDHEESLGPRTAQRSPMRTKADLSFLHYDNREISKTFKLVVE